jgi:hypothetical protein
MTRFNVGEGWEDDGLEVRHALLGDRCATLTDPRRARGTVHP